MAVLKLLSPPESRKFLLHGRLFILVQREHIIVICPAQVTVLRTPSTRRRVPSFLHHTWSSWSAVHAQTVWVVIYVIHSGSTSSLRLQFLSLHQIPLYVTGKQRPL